MTKTRVLDGKAFADNLLKKVAAAGATIIENHGITPGLAVVLVGQDPASQVYVRNKGRQTIAAGFKSQEYKLSIDTSQSELLKLLHTLNNDSTIHGILVQLPLPNHIDADLVLATIDPDKDVDGFHPINIGRLWSGLPGLVPCTPLGCSLLLDDVIGDMSGLNAVVVGRSNIVGKPMAALLLRRHCTLTVCHSRSHDLPTICRQADILVAAVGRPKMVQGDWIKDGAHVIDVGINRIPSDNGKSRLVGDVDFAQASQHAGLITPVPGGVGPMTIACLLRNTLTATCLQHHIDQPEL